MAPTRKLHSQLGIGQSPAGTERYFIYNIRCYDVITQRAKVNKTLFRLKKKKRKRVEEKQKF